MTKNKIKYYIPIFFILISCILTVKGEIYSLRSLFGKGDGSNNNSKKTKPVSSVIKTDLNLLLMPSEPMVINGLNLELGLALTQMNLADCLRYFNRRYKDVKFKINNNAFLISFKNEQNQIERYYFFQDRPKAMTNCFYMTIPKNAPKKPKQWLKNVPRVSGVKALQTIELPTRNNSMARFSYVGNKDAVINEFNRRLSNEGYIALGDDPEHSRYINQSGNLFIKEDASEIIIFSLSDTGTGSILKKKLPKKNKK